MLDFNIFGGLMVGALALQGASPLVRNTRSILSVQLWNCCPEILCIQPSILFQHSIPSVGPNLGFFWVETHQIQCVHQPSLCCSRGVRVSVPCPDTTPALHFFHSIFSTSVRGYSSDWWCSLPSKTNQRNYQHLRSRACLSEPSTEPEKRMGVK